MELKTCIILVILFLIICYYGRIHNPNNKLKEDFSSDITNTVLFDGKESNGHITCILPFYDSETGYLGTYYKKDLDTTNNLIKTYTIKDNKWFKEPLCNGAIDPYTVIIDLTWSHDILDDNNIPGKRLMAIGMRLNNKKEYVYKTYIKKTNDIESEWEPLFKNSDIDKSIICIRYDLNDNIIGISNKDYQLYKFIPNYTDTYGEWVGPINFSSIKLNKIMFSKDKLLMGISRDKGQIHCKNDYNWETSKWISNRNKKPPPYNNELQLYDCVYDVDGKLIGTTSHGLIKQTFNSWFSDFTEYSDKNKNIHVLDKNMELSKSSIVMCRTGDDTDKFNYIPLPPLDNQSNSNFFKNEDGIDMNGKRRLIQSLNGFLNFKRKMMHNCNKTQETFKDTSLKNSQSLIELYNSEMDDIHNLMVSLENKGYSL